LLLLDAKIGAIQPLRCNGRLCENALGPPLPGDFGRSSIPAAPLWPSNDEENELRME